MRSRITQLKIEQGHLIIIEANHRHSREGGNPGFTACKRYYEWIPAFAGMTTSIYNEVALKNRVGEIEKFNYTTDGPDLGLKRL